MAKTIQCIAQSLPNTSLPAYTASSPQRAPCTILSHFLFFSILFLSSTTIQADALAIDPLGLVAGQEADNAGDIEGKAVARERRDGGGHLQALLGRVLGAIGDVVVRGGVEHVGDGAAGGHGVDGDLLVARVLGQAADKGLDGALGGRVERVAGHAEAVRRVGRHEDDAAALVEVLVRLAGDKELRARVEAEDAVKLLLCKGTKKRRKKSARSVSKFGQRGKPATVVRRDGKERIKRKHTSVTSSRWPKLTTPELLQTMSRPPKWATTSSIRRVISATLRMSAFKAMASVPKALISATTFSADSRELA